MMADKDTTAGPLPGWIEITRWAIVHDLIAHPLMALTRYSRWSMRFHTWSARRAWKPRHNLPPML